MSRPKSASLNGRPKPSSLSLVPAGLLAALIESETRDMLTYLINRAQVPLPRPKRF